MDLEVEQLACGDELPRRRPVLGARTAVAARVVVRDDHRGRAEQQRGPEDDAPVDVPVTLSLLFNASRMKCSWSASRCAKS